MPPCYFVCFAQIHDGTRFAKDYVFQTRSSIEAAGGRTIAASDERETLEGSLPPGRVVLIEFADLAAARKWYESKGYEPLLALRKAVATSSVILVPGGMAFRD